MTYLELSKQSTDNVIEPNWGLLPDTQKSQVVLKESAAFTAGHKARDWRRKWQPTLVFLPGESHGQRSLAGYSPRDLKSRTRLSN